MFGAAFRTEIGASLPPIDRPGHERGVAAIHVQPGESAFTKAWVRGATERDGPKDY